MLNVRSDHETSLLSAYYTFVSVKAFHGQTMVNMKSAPIVYVRAQCIDMDLVVLVITMTNPIIWTKMCV
jgi:hypothetical protein